MAVSGSTDFKQTAQELIIDARAELGVQADEEPLQAVDLERGLRTLTRMLKTWQADGVEVWTFTQGSIPLVQGDLDYVCGAGGAFVTTPFDILECRVLRDGNSLPMFRLSRDEYLDLPNRTNQGYPTQFYYDRQRDFGTIYVWPAPDAALGTLEFDYRRIVMDADAGPNDMDLPQEWTEAIMFGLAKAMIGQYHKAGTPEAAWVMQEADRTYQIVKNYDIGEGKASVSITPDYDDYRGWRRG